MMSLPSIQIHQSFARIGLDSELHRMVMRQPHATFEMKTDQPSVDIRQFRGELRVDQSKAWDALGTGSILRTMDRIAAQTGKAAMHGIARIVEDGNRLAAIHTGGNPIAENAERAKADRFELEVTGPVSSLNVYMAFTPRWPEIHWTEGKIHANVRRNRPEIDFRQGKLDVYVAQQARIEITPPQIDLKL